MTDLAGASRPIMWNVEQAWLMYLFFIVALGVFAFGVARRVARLREGQPDGVRLGQWVTRLGLMVRALVFQPRTNRSRWPGVFHSLVYYSFAVLIVTTTVIGLDYDLGTSLFRGWTYVVLSVGAEAGGVLILVGLAMALWRRLVTKPSTLQSSGADVWSLALIALMVLTGFATEGMRIASLGDPWAALSPVGLLFSLPFTSMTPETREAGHQVAWWGHMAIGMAWIALIPYTKFAHLLMAPSNLFFQKLEPRGQLQRDDIEAMMTREDFDFDNFKVGVETAADFTWKERLDFDSCLGCGRCEEVCPATRAGGTSFSPRDFIARSLAAVDALGGAETSESPAALVDGAMDATYVWNCRTCMACTEVCPVAIDHVDTLMEVRRNETLMQARMPSEAGRTLRLLEKTGNPFGAAQSERSDWIEQAGIPVVGRGEEVDVLLWIGCTTTFDPSKRRIAEDLCTLLTACGIDYGVLGSDERCCGDPARVMGEERLFQDIAKAQIEQLNSRKFKIILTACPHCYNVLKNEYPTFGADFEVVHHSEFLHEMLYEGTLKPEIANTQRVTYHDPCYLGRYQGITEAPRQVLGALPGAEVVEMQHHGVESMCCGGGGGHFWMDLPSDERINDLRVTEATDVGADTIVTACSFCKQMLEDSVKTLDLDGKVQVTDLVTMVLQSLPKPKVLPAEEVSEVEVEPVLKPHEHRPRPLPAGRRPHR